MVRIGGTYTIGRVKQVCKIIFTYSRRYGLRAVPYKQHG